MQPFVFFFTLLALSNALTINTPPAFVSPPVRVLPNSVTTLTVSIDISGQGATSTVLFLDPSSGGASYFDTTGFGCTQTQGNNRCLQYKGTISGNAIVGHYDLYFHIQSNGVAYGVPLLVSFELTCSDGLFCNGEERWSKGACVTGTNPCNDNVACTVDTCFEGNKTCWYQPTGNNCASNNQKACSPRCGKKICGSDKCGGLCGTCPSPQVCVDGTSCQVPTTPGTCTNPIPLFPGTDGSTTAIPPLTLWNGQVNGDTTLGYDVTTIPCGALLTNKIIYSISIPSNYPTIGFEIMVLHQSLDPLLLDTVVGILESDCSTQILTNGFCSDDAQPPGGVGSRLFGTWAPGKDYRLVISGWGPADIGPFALLIKTNPMGCVPVCAYKPCGSDGCGLQCGVIPCGSNQNCTNGQCVNFPCVANCTKRKCGPDGCGGSCGTCKGTDLCSDTIGKCFPGNTCDNLRPVCKGGRGCGLNKYCASDCQCYKTTKALVDLIIAPPSTFYGSLYFEWRNFDDPASCVFSETCVSTLGNRLLMRFATDVVNQSPLAGFYPGNPVRQPAIFTWGQCHQHWHFKCFARSKLMKTDVTTVLVAGTKQAFCMDDTYQYILGPNINAEADTECSSQGISPGWVDSYTPDLDCQWLDITDVPRGKWYIFEQCTNPCRYFPEMSFDNNCQRLPVYVPNFTSGIKHYSDITPPTSPPSCPTCTG